MNDRPAPPQRPAPKHALACLALALTATAFALLPACKPSGNATATNGPQPAAQVAKEPAEPAGQPTGAGGSAPAAGTYPLTTCVVSGEELGSMGEPHVIEHEGQTVKFCCDHCVPKFEADPAKYLAVIDAATTKAQ